MSIETEVAASELSSHIVELINSGLEDEEIWNYIRHYPNINYPKLIAVIRLLIMKEDFNDY